MVAANADNIQRTHVLLVLLLALTAHACTGVMVQ